MTEDTEDRDRIVCMPVTSTAHVPSTLVECGDCRAPLWRSNASLEQDLDPICFGCLPADSKPAASMVQIMEIAEATGQSALEVANWMAGMGIEIVDG